MAWVGLSLAACQTAPRKEWDRIQLGMQKTDVLAAAGNPQVTRRVHGRDRWTYERYDESTPREIEFEDGRVIYTGPPQKPSLTAEEQDRRNEEANRKIEERETAMAKQRDLKLGIARPDFETPTRVPNETPASLPADYESKFNESMYGTPADISIEKRKVAPVFEPVE